MDFDIEIVTLSRTGGRSYNEDAFGHWNDGQHVVCVVADGAGGHGGGDVASQVVRASVLGGFAERPGVDAQLLRELVERANLDVVARQSEGGRLAGMRSTVVLAAIDLPTQRVAFAHCGDSRAYLFRGGRLLLRTVDHSLVQQMVTGGMLDEEGARSHPQRNMLLSALGSVEVAPDITVSPPLPLQVGDVLLLCTDGLWEPLDDDCLTELLAASRDAGGWVAQLDAQVRARAKPGHDNYTALVLWAREDDETTRLLP
ncbi:PP2C family protein-serine/threonine phosphatase [Variovorax sp.]|uniref:PP2C family protein-serine/threonine phosphatase n=1 Tax=Variovorax sp. TaxID=1871043 RepID=UPI002D5748C6|nr:protein phosphatase 2C domain-containing protein [Variovorax sp.]HYP84236.1 protein phosphatase 2C domain-containing protein [Variovorax sp.]